jgi:hypothetical protein
MKVALKAPKADVVTAVGLVVCANPLNAIVTVEVGAKPAPMTVTLVLTRPEVGDRAIDGVTVNVADAVFELASVAVTVLLPAMDEGTTKVAVKAPKVDVSTVAGMVVTFTPLNVIVMVEEGVKPAPVTATEVPTGPEVGFRVIDREMVKVAFPELAALKFESPAYEAWIIELPERRPVTFTWQAAPERTHEYELNETFPVPPIRDQPICSPLTDFTNPARVAVHWDVEPSGKEIGMQLIAVVVGSRSVMVVVPELPI